MKKLPKLLYATWQFYFAQKGFIKFRGIIYIDNETSVKEIKIQKIVVFLNIFLLSKNKYITVLHPKTNVEIIENINKTVI